MTDSLILILSTCPDADSAGSIARALVESGNAACVNQLPGIRSTYRWQGKLCNDEEVLLLIKTTEAQLENIRQCIAVAHPYELPELVAVPITAGSPAYLQWLADATGHH